jgi:predicted nucleotide-binding protein
MPAIEEAYTAKPKRLKVSQTEFPNHTLQQALRIAHAIWDNFAGKGAAPHEIAMAVDMSPTSGTWRNLCGSSIAYGLTEGGYAASETTLTELGRRIVAPIDEDDDVTAQAEAALRPRILGQFFQKYNKAKFPTDQIARNVLVSMGLPKERAERALEILKENGQFTGIIRETKTGPFVAIDTPSRRPVELDGGEWEAGLSASNAMSASSGAGQGASKHSSASQSAGQDVASEPARANSAKQLFVAHGKNRGPLGDLKKILTEFKIPYKVAVDEPNKGRPISAKVAELMDECSAGVFIFTRDEKFFRKTDQGEEEVWRPSENVVYELGAASKLWDRKIIILREEGVNFPSDFNDLGYITFKDGEIAHKALDLLKELIGLELVRFEAA